RGLRRIAGKDCWRNGARPESGGGLIVRRLADRSAGEPAGGATQVDCTSRGAERGFGGGRGSGPGDSHRTASSGRTAVRPGSGSGAARRSSTFASSAAGGARAFGASAHR